MALDDDPTDDRLPPRPPVHPDDRLWRHPSELAQGTPPPAAWAMPAPQRTPPRRAMAIAALTSACLTGAVVAVGVMWFTRPTRVVVQEVAATTAAPATTARFSTGMVPSADLAADLANSLVVVQASRDGIWTAGTGLWLDDQGTVAVASSLVNGAAAIVVTDAEGTRLPALAAGADAATGIAVLRASDASGNAVTATAGNVRPGQSVIAVGAPSAVDGASAQRVMPAAVSATGVRTTVDLVLLHNAVQLDRPLPSDAVGSLIIDSEGQLVAIVLAGSGEDDLAVAIPAQDALDAAKDLRDHGEVRRAWLGVQATDLDPGLAERLDVRGGALLTVVEPGSPAEAAGLLAGDVITGIGDHHVNGASDLVMSLRKLTPGTVVDISWTRGTEPQSAPATLGG